MCDILRKFDFNDVYRLFCNDPNIDNNELNLSFSWYHFTIGEYQEALRKIAHINTSLKKIPRRCSFCLHEKLHKGI